MKNELEIKEYYNELNNWYNSKKDGMSQHQKTQLSERIFVLKWILDIGMKERP